MLTINKKIISKNAVKVESILGKALGLMFKAEVKEPLIFIFLEDKLVPLHMWFVFTAIDVIYLDKRKKIIEIKENFKPFTFYNPKKKARFVVELKKGTIAKFDINLGQQVSF
ncbi:DUF192 domain-containing protein [Candidatus Woesearchaeota archaeon]|nr:DUF192 domain-containing protein [Candidatus Woesearchaeota archaeon]